MPQTKAESAPLHADIELLTGKLDEAVLQISGEKALGIVRALRAEAIAMRAGTPGATRERFGQHVAALDLDQLSVVARAFTLWFHLTNAAEEQQRVRALRRHDREHPPADSLAKAIEQMASEGLDADEVRAQLTRLFVMPVLTAHPTEARRRTLRDHVTEIRRVLDALQCPQGPRGRAELLERLDYVVTL